MAIRETLNRLAALELERHASGALPDKITLVTVEPDPSTGELVEVGEPVVIWRTQAVEEMTDEQLAAVFGAVEPLDCGKSRIHTTGTPASLSDEDLGKMLSAASASNTDLNSDC